MILEDGIVGYVYQSYLKEKKESFNLKIEGNKLSGINYKNNTVGNIKDCFSERVEIYDANGNILSSNQLVGTGTKVKLQNNEELTVILYGDVNGDGKINSIDLLVLQRHILEIEKIRGAYLIAGNISKNGKNPTSLDSLLIQRHILGVEIIEQ